MIMRSIRPKMGYGYRWIFFMGKNHSQLFSGFYALLFLISFYCSQSNWWNVGSLPSCVSRFHNGFSSRKILTYPLSDEKLGMKGSLITTAVLVVLYTLGVLLSMRVNVIRKWIQPSPFPLIKNGEIMYNGLGKARITLDHLLSEARKEKIEEIHKFVLALWEPDGTISFFLFPRLHPVTPEDIQLISKPFSMPLIIIKTRENWFEMNCKYPVRTLHGWTNKLELVQCGRSWYFIGDDWYS